MQVVIKLEDSDHRPPEFVHGVNASYSVIDGGCAPEYIEVPLTPLGAYRLFGTPMNHLAGQLVDLRDVLGADGRRLGHLLRDAPTWRQRFDALDRFLLQRVASAPTVAAEVEFAWHTLVVSGGRSTIRAISDEVGWSHKHLIARFTHQVGLTPKRVARLIRFERVLRAVDSGRATDWTAIATAVGYADQAHLIRDFNEFTGRSPTAHLATTSAHT